MKQRSSADISAAVIASTHLYGCVQMLGILLKREGGEYLVGEMSGESEKERNRKGNQLLSFP